MTVGKRLFDIIVALLLVAILGVPFALLLVWLALREGFPLFHVAERMRAPGQPFLLWKLRTMTVARGDSGVTGADKTGRITPLGALLRKIRADEIPQLYNVLKGDMSFVGPRPPLRQYVERFPGIYARVLRSRPGITGLASLVYHAHEERLLARCKTAEETDAVYSRICVPAKAKLDLIWQRHWSLCFDMVLMGKTLARVFRRRGRARG